MLTVLGIALGLVVSFRTSSAYDHYWEGHKLWSSMQLQSRNLASIIWVHISFERNGTAEDPPAKDWRLRVYIEKKTMVNLVQAFSVAVKHYLRGEPGILYEDLYPLVSCLPQHSAALEDAANGYDFRTVEDVLPIWRAIDVDHGTRLVDRTPNTPTENESDLQGNQDTEVNSKKEGVPTKPKMPSGTGIHLRPSRLPRKSAHGLRHIIQTIVHLAKPDRDSPPHDEKGHRAVAQATAESNVPLEIMLFLQSYQAWVIKQELINGSISAAFSNGLSSFQDIITALERVRSTPIPFAYRMHLRMSVWLYLLFLPFQILSSLNWITIPATAFASFLFLGFVEIGAELENPFNYEADDLDLDRFCEAIARELAEITAPVVDPSQYIFGEWNNPFAPADSRSAGTILANVEHDYHQPEYGLIAVRRTLLRSWRTARDEVLAYSHI